VTQEERVRVSFARQGLLATLGAQVVHVAPGEVDVELAFDERLTQQHGYLHAGALTAALDSACGYSALTLMPEEAAVLTVEFKVNLLAPAEGERFLARGRVVPCRPHAHRVPRRRGRARRGRRAARRDDDRDDDGGWAARRAGRLASTGGERGAAATRPRACGARPRRSSRT
jgi:uncharacterized protein (TIGR00369 family)